MWRDRFRADLSPAVMVDLVNNYRQHLTTAETHVRRALQTLETIGRFPARTFLTDPTTDPNTQPPEPPFHPTFPPGSGLAVTLCP